MLDKSKTNAVRYTRPNKYIRKWISRVDPFATNPIGDDLTTQKISLSCKGAWLEIGTIRRKGVSRITVSQENVCINILGSGLAEMISFPSVDL